MTISTELRKAGPFTGNGVTTAFPFSFKVFAASDVAVTRADTQGAETALVLNSDFTVALNPDQDAVPGGTVTLAAPLASGHRLTVTSAVPNLQPTDITNNGGFYPRVIEDALDRHVAQIQQIDEKVDRALKVAITSPLGDQALPSPVAGMLIGWNESNDGLKNYAPIGGTLLGQQLAAANGSSLVGFQQAGTGAVAATVQAKLRETVSVKDFGAVGDGVADDYSAFDQANTNGAFQIPPGTYKIGTNLTLTNKVSFMPGATLAPDAGVTIVFADGQGEIDVQWFGAKGDGVTDDTTAIQNAINSGYDIFLPPTNAGYKVAGNGTGQRLLIPARRNIYGDFFKTKILHSNDDWLFEIRGSFIGVSRLQIDAGAATTSGRGQFLIRSDLSGLERIWLKEIETDQSFQFLRDSKSGVNLIVNLQLEDVICRRHRGNGLDLEDGFAYCRFTNVTVDYVNSVSKNHTAYRVLNNAGSVWTNVDVTGGQVDGTTSSQHGFFFSNCIAVWMNNCMADTVGGHGFYFFTDCRAFYMSQCISSLNGLAGFYMAGSGNINNMFVNCVCGGRKNQSYSVPLQAGWFVLNGVGTQLTGCKSVENTGAGMYFQDSIITNVTGGTIASNTTWGIETIGTNGGIYSAVSINQPSSSGNASLATTIEHLVNCQLTSGIVGNLTGPGTI